MLDDALSNWGADRAGPSLSPLPRVPGAKAKPRERYR
jgi:hypothetical protein